MVSCGFWRVGGTSCAKISSFGEQLQDYFALCLSCHHATVATFVPTDVDTKIRGITWRETRDPQVLRPMLRVALAAQRWTDEGISTRNVRGVSGTQWQSTGVRSPAAWDACWNSATTEAAEEAQAAIEAEIDREQAVFDRVAAWSAMRNSTCYDWR